MLPANDWQLHCSILNSACRRNLSANGKTARLYHFSPNQRPAIRHTHHYPAPPTKKEKQDLSRFSQKSKIIAQYSSLLPLLLSSSISCSRVYPILSIYYPKYLSSSPLNALPCLASSRAISWTVSWIASRFRALALLARSVLPAVAPFSASTRS